MAQPNFLFVGPDRAGSTFLFNILRSHPSIYIPKLKDSYYFCNFYGKKSRSFLSPFSRSTNRHTCVGELSHDYVFDDLARARIAKSFPNIKILIMVRNQSDRSISHWKFRQRSGVVMHDYQNDFFECPGLALHGKYGAFVSKWGTSFPSDQIAILSFDTLKTDPKQFCRNLAGALDVDAEGFSMPDPKDRNQAKMPISSGVIKYSRMLGNVLRAVGLGQLWGRLKTSAILKRALFTSEIDSSSVRKNFCLAAAKSFGLDISELENRTNQSWPELYS